MYHAPYKLLENTMKIFLHIILCLLFLCTTPAQAQNNIDPVKFQKTINELNRLKPLQNPRYKLSKKILYSHIVDRKNKTIGKLEDILITENGDISSLFVSFDRMHLRNSVYLNYQNLDIIGTGSGYKLDIDKKEVANIYPNLLANIETAAGQSNIVSLSSLLGKNVYNAKNERIAKIQDILFDQYGEKIKAIYLNVGYKNTRNKGVSIPYTALNIENNNGYIKLSINQDLSDIIVKYAKNK